MQQVPTIGRSTQFDKCAFRADRVEAIDMDLAYPKTFVVLVDHQYILQRPTHIHMKQRGIEPAFIRQFMINDLVSRIDARMAS